MLMYKNKRNANKRKINMTPQQKTRETLILIEIGKLYSEQSAMLTKELKQRKNISSSNRFICQRS